MSQSTSGPCLVCGEETTSRCEACRHAGIDLFFCSREHQRLLWPLHKKVCGSRANPFTWPGLSEVEAAQAKKRLPEQMALANLTLSQAMIAKGLPKVGLEAFIDDLREGSSNDPGWAMRQNWTVHVRANETVLTVLSPGYKSSEPNQTLELVFRYSACMSFESLKLEYVSTSPRHLPPYYSRFHHLLSAWYGLSWRGETASSPAERLKMNLLATGAVQRLIAYVQTEVREVDPASAQRFLEAIADYSLAEAVGGPV